MNWKSFGTILVLYPSHATTDNCKYVKENYVLITNTCTYLTENRRGHLQLYSTDDAMTDAINFSNRNGICRNLLYTSKMLSSKPSTCSIVDSSPSDNTDQHTDKILSKYSLLISGLSKIKDFKHKNHESVFL